MDYVALYDYSAQGEDELSLNSGELLKIISKDIAISGDDGWWVGKIHNQVGIVPSNFVIPVATRITESSIKVTKLIGEGGFSRVYLGKYGNYQEEVAVKVSKLDTDNALEDIKTEGRLNMMLNHPNIVRFIGFYGNSIVMEFCHGGSLGGVLKVGTGLELGVVRNWAKQICDGMEYLHQNNIIHRDLKSNNILLANPADSDFNTQILKITDFGLAREIAHTTRMSAAGTYAWMSPEVIKASSFSKASDVWSYGVLVWELLTCEVPYKGIEPFTIAYGIAVNKLTLPTHEGCPTEWTKLMEACWDQDPHLRPSFQAIQNQLVKMPSEVKNFDQIISTWRDNIDALLAEKISDKVKELQTREMEMSRLYKMKLDNLHTLEKKLKQKEIALLHRELKIALRPEPRKRKAKFNKNLIKNGTEFISEPMDFHHKLNIQPINAGDSGRFRTWSPHANGRRHGRQSIYWSSPNLFNSKKTKDSNGNENEPKHSPVESAILSIGTTFASIVSGFDLRKPNERVGERPPAKDMKFNTYNGKTTKKRTSLPGRGKVTEV